MTVAVSFVLNQDVQTAVDTQAIARMLANGVPLDVVTQTMQPAREVDGKKMVHESLA